MKNNWINENREEWNKYQKEYRQKRMNFQKSENKKSYLKHGKKWKERADFIGQTQAKGKVANAIKNGLLLSLKLNIIKCSYCSERAFYYEHRDYNKPLEVSPVCYLCNKKLGSAIPLKREGIQ